MQSNLSIQGQILAYTDQTGTSNPQKQLVNYATKRLYQVQNTISVSQQVDPNATISLFNTGRTIGIDGTTELVLTVSTLSPSRYRITWDGTGTDPGFRTDRGLTLNTDSITMTSNGNLTLTMGGPTGVFTAVLVGDTVFIPGVATGDSAGPFNPLNTGTWNVLSKINNQTLVLGRPTGTSFSGITETVTITSNSQVLAYSAAGVQVGDFLKISAGFPTPVFGSYQILAVTSKWVEFNSTSILPVTATATPGATGFQFFSGFKRWLRIEADQPVVIQLNGNSNSTTEIVPWTPGDPDNTGVFELAGGVFSCTVINQSSNPLNLLLISAQ